MTNRSTRIKSVVLLGIASFVMGTNAEAQSLVSNGLFNTNIDGWTLIGGGPETVITWDGVNGSPAPGSLRMSSTLMPAQGATIEALSDCIATIPDEIITSEGMVLEPTPQAGVGCFITLALYQGANCTGNRLFTFNFPPNTPGVWEESGFAFNVSTVYMSAQASLTMELAGPGPGEKVCFFDTVSMTSDSRGVPIAGIPTISWPGLLVLSLLIAMAATLLVKGSRKLSR